MFRVYNNEEKKWVKDDVYLTPYDELVKIKQSVFGLVKVQLSLSPDKYTFHRDIGLYDKDGDSVYEGDYLRATISEDKTVVGLVCYAHELSSYIILVDSTNEFFTLGSEVSSEIQIIGNVFDGYDGEESDGSKCNEAL